MVTLIKCMFVGALLCVGHVAALRLGEVKNETEKTLFISVLISNSCNVRGDDCPPVIAIRPGGSCYVGWAIPCHKPEMYDLASLFESEECEEEPEWANGVLAGMAFVPEIALSRSYKTTDYSKGALTLSLWVPGLPRPEHRNVLFIGVRSTEARSGVYGLFSVNPSPAGRGSSDLIKELVPNDDEQPQPEEMINITVSRSGRKMVIT